MENVQKKGNMHEDVLWIATHALCVTHKNGSVKIVQLSGQNLKTLKSEEKEHTYTCSFNLTWEACLPCPVWYSIIYETEIRITNALQ